MLSEIGCVRSSFREVTSGVPQGSVLGPFLFSVVMGSLEIGASDCAIVKYADDLTLSVRVGFFPDKTILSGKNWKKLEKTGFFRKKLEETGKNWKNWKTSYVLLNEE